MASIGDTVSGLTWQRCLVCREQKPEMVLVAVLPDCSFKGNRIFRCAGCDAVEPKPCRRCGQDTNYEGYCRPCRTVTE